MNFEKFIQKKYKKKEKLNDYLSIKKGFLYYKNIKLISLIKKFGTPLEVAYTDMINERIKSLKDIFKKAIKENNYPSKFIYAYATKANYYSEVISTALNNVDALETTSSYDLDIVEVLLKRKLINKNIPIICNGFKHGRYFEKIEKLKRLGLNIIPILENKEEVILFADKTKLKFDLGIRLNIDKEIVKSFEKGKRLSSDIDSRFGVDFKEMIECAELIERALHLKFKIFHFHIGGTINDINKYINFVGNLFEKKYCKLKKRFSDLEFFDLGGGLPVQYNLNFKFDYYRIMSNLIKKIKEISKKQKIAPPNIIGEYGRYTANDHGFSLFKIDLVKKTRKKDTFWYLINSSLMNFLPDSWALGQEFIILPLNLWSAPFCKVKLGGMTCDPDDTYYKNEKDNILHMPIIPKGKELYIGIFGVGAYQEMISGVGGVHHCLLPEGIELIIYKKKGKLYFDKITKLQTPQNVLKILDYHRHHKLRRYKK